MIANETDTASKCIERIGNPVAKRIEIFLENEIKRWSELDATLQKPLTVLRDFVLAGGKRLRPAFCYWAYVGAGGDESSSSIVDAGAALELLHSFALVHDDVMDDASQRRGSDAVHVQFAQLHNSSSWNGESGSFGDAAAILVGDMAFVYADLMMRGANEQAIEVFNEMRVELNVGQYLDMSASVAGVANLALAQRIARYKSGKYTVERPMHLGAALAGKYNEHAMAFSAYGIPVGEAFQLRDDLLGAFGEEDLTGKPVGGDLREGKPTALLAMARDRAKGAQGEFLEQRYGAKDLSDQEIHELQQVLIDTGARDDLEATIDTLVATGLRGLEVANISADANQALTELAYFVAGREF